MLDTLIQAATVVDGTGGAARRRRRFLPGVGHWVQQEAPDEVNEILSAWLTGAPVPGNPHRKPR
jgi:pimeloyl-ACP methyl ester carboxylesterase